MRPARMMIVAVSIIAATLVPHVARTQAPGITRTDLRRNDLSIPGREAIQVLVGFAPGITAPGTRIPVERSFTWSRASWYMNSTASHL